MKWVVLCLACLVGVAASGEVIGDVEFKPPVSLKEWIYFEDSEAEGKVLFKNYARKTDQFTEILITTSASEFPGSISTIDYTKNFDVPKFLEKLKVGTSQEFPGWQISYSDIQVEPKSFFYKTTATRDQSLMYSWERQMITDKQWITFRYSLSFDESSAAKDIDSMTDPWIAFIRDNLSKKTYRE